MHIRKSYYEGGGRNPVPKPSVEEALRMQEKGLTWVSPSVGYVKLKKAEHGMRMPQGQPGQTQGDPQGPGAAPDVEALLEMLSQMPSETTVGEVIEFIMGDKPGNMPPPSPLMQ